jgi:hypothetical protein
VVEEIDRVRAGSGKLRNLGWSHYEGRRVYDSGERLRGGRLVMPVHTYHHPSGSSVIGGAVYRGSLSPALAGFYVYGDFDGWIAGFDVTDTASSFTFDTGVTLLTISQAADGELYAGFADGTVQHIGVAAG